MSRQEQVTLAASVVVLSVWALWLLLVTGVIR